MQMKTLLAALALSPSSKAITEIDERTRLVVERHWTPVEIWLSAYLVDIKEGDVTHCIGKLGGPDALQDWVYNCALDANIDPEGNIGGTEKRWESLEEKMLNEATNYLAGLCSIKVATGTVMER